MAGPFLIVHHDPTVVLDGAHNAAAAERLAATLREHFAGRQLTLILGVLRDKNYDQMCQILAPLAVRVLCVPVNSERTSEPVSIGAVVPGGEFRCAHHRRARSFRRVRASLR